MGTPRTLKRRRQRQATRRHRRERAAQWAALSPEEREREVRWRRDLTELSKVTAEAILPTLVETYFKDSVFLRALKQR